MQVDAGKLLGSSVRVSLDLRFLYRPVRQAAGGSYADHSQQQLAATDASFRAR